MAEGVGRTRRLPDLAALLAAADYDGIAELAARDRLALPRLLGLCLDADEVTGRRAVRALGQASAVTAARDPEFVRGILRRLAWSLNHESGSVGWRSPEAMGAVIAASPAAFPEFVPLVLSLLELRERVFLPGTLWAIAHMAENGVPGLEGVTALVHPYLAAEEPEVRGMAARCAGALGDARGKSSDKGTEPPRQEDGKVHQGGEAETEPRHPSSGGRGDGGEVDPAGGG